MVYWITWCSTVELCHTATWYHFFSELKVKQILGLNSPVHHCIACTPCLYTDISKTLTELMKNSVPLAGF